MSEQLKIFIGYDSRVPAAYNILQHSIIRRSSVPVSITPIVYNQVCNISNTKIRQDGLTEFTFTRFMVPYLCDYKGWALFIDADMIVLDDIKNLFDFRNSKYTAMVVDYGDKVADGLHLAFERGSIILYNCSKCKKLTPDFINKPNKNKNETLHSLAWVPEGQLGSLPEEWGHLVGYQDNMPGRKLLHYTQGVPTFPDTYSSEYALEYFLEKEIMNGIYSSWTEFMGTSVHAARLDNGDRLPKFVAKQLIKAGVLIPQTKKSEINDIPNIKK